MIVLEGGNIYRLGEGRWFLGEDGWEVGGSLAVGMCMSCSFHGLEEVLGSFS